MCHILFQIPLLKKTFYIMHLLCINVNTIFFLIKIISHLNILFIQSLLNSYNLYIVFNKKFNPISYKIRYINWIPKQLSCRQFCKCAKNLTYSLLKVLQFKNDNINNVSKRWYIVWHTSFICGIEHWIWNEMGESFKPSREYNRIANW